MYHSDGGDNNHAYIDTNDDDDGSTTAHSPGLMTLPQRAMS